MTRLFMLVPGCQLEPLISFLRFDSGLALERAVKRSVVSGNFEKVLEKSGQMTSKKQWNA